MFTIPETEVVSQHNIKSKPIDFSIGFVLALTYLPGPSPDKYFRHW